MPSLSRLDRRDLMKAALSAGLPAWFAAELAAADEPAKQPAEKPKVALVGCGGMGRGDAANAFAPAAAAYSPASCAVVWKRCWISRAGGTVAACRASWTSRSAPSCSLSAASRRPYSWNRRLPKSWPTASLESGPSGWLAPLVP